MNKKMLINFLPDEECRIVITDKNNKIEDLFMEHPHDNANVGNIYMGKIVSVKPSLQAAFVDIGSDRKAFLHVSGIHPRFYYNKKNSNNSSKHRNKKESIEKLIRVGQLLPVQITKEELGHKGAAITTYLSLPGRFLVLLPWMSNIAVSQKIEDEKERKRAKKILRDVSDDDRQKQQFGVIMRTAGMGKPKNDFKRDLAYLKRLWKTIRSRIRGRKDVSEIYKETDLVIRTIRDVISNDISEIIVDNYNIAQKAKDFLKIAMPRGKTRVYHYNRPVPLFHAYNIEKQIEAIYERTIYLSQGSSIIIEPTEALVSIDVNSGSRKKHKNLKETIYQTNMEAADEICRQLRLRDLGGLIICDLIDMWDNKQKRAVERKFKNNLKRDRAKTNILKISKFGIMQITRQRVKKAYKKQLYEQCSQCLGTGLTKKIAPQTYYAIREIGSFIYQKDIKKIHVICTPEFANEIFNKEKQKICTLEKSYHKEISFTVSEKLEEKFYKLELYDKNENQISFNSVEKGDEPELGNNDEVTNHGKRSSQTNKSSSSKSSKPSNQGNNRNQNSGKSSNQQQQSKSRNRNQNSGKSSSQQQQNKSNNRNQNSGKSSSQQQQSKSRNPNQNSGKSSSSKSNKPSNQGNNRNQNSGKSSSQQQQNKSNNRNQNSGKSSNQQQQNKSRNPNQNSGKSSSSKSSKPSNQGNNRNQNSGKSSSQQQQNKSNNRNQNSGKSSGSKSSKPSNQGNNRNQNSGKSSGSKSSKPSGNKTSKSSNSRKSQSTKPSGKTKSDNKSEQKEKKRSSKSKSSKGNNRSSNQNTGKSKQSSTKQKKSSDSRKSPPKKSQNNSNKKDGSSKK
ncbi:MAG: ribonuclease E/G [Deltaproteobacteria bacterium]|jgi:ribonuclease E|nr:ribonuclease E/G [Deltaproteobacteria bacterium]